MPLLPFLCSLRTPFFILPSSSTLPQAAVSHNHGAWKAIDPCNAVLNYAYAILESQTRQALSSVGFDCAAGFLHSDLLYRDSLVFDVMDILRPKVDDLVLQLLSTVIYHKGDLKALADGQVRFNPQFARYIAASCQLPQKEVDESVTWFKSLLMKD